MSLLVENKGGSFSVKPQETQEVEMTDESEQETENEKDNEKALNVAK